MGISNRRQDHYAVLGVSPEAPDDVIRAAYRALAAKYHPDRNPGDRKAELEFKRVNAAFQVLGEPEKRKLYDELTQSPIDSEPPAAPRVAPTVTPARDTSMRATPGPSENRARRLSTQPLARSQTSDSSDDGHVARARPHVHRSGGVRALYALAAMGLSLWLNASDTPLSRQNDAAVVGLIVGILVLGLLVYWVTGKRIGVPIVIALCVIAVGVHAASDPSHHESYSSQERPTADPTYAPTIPTATPPPRQLRKLTPLEWQRCLLSSGYDIGPTGADGVWGAQSQTAYNLWQLRHPDGLVTADEIRRCWGE